MDVDDDTSVVEALLSPQGMNPRRTAHGGLIFRSDDGTLIARGAVTVFYLDLSLKKSSTGGLDFLL